MINYFDACKILEISPPLTEENIKKAYKIKAVKHHPDTGGSHDAFIRLQEAYNLLKDFNYNSQEDSYGAYSYRSATDYSTYREERDYAAYTKRNTRGASKPATPKLNSKEAFLKYWKAVYKQAQCQLKLSIPPGRIGETIERALKEYEQKVQEIDPAWFSHGLFKTTTHKRKLAYKNFLLFIAPDANQRFEWAQRFFELEFGERFHG